MAKMAESCSVCGSETVVTEFMLRDGQVVHCKTCTVSYLKNTFSEAQMQQLYDVQEYPKEHFTFYCEGLEQKLLQDYRADFSYVENNLVKEGSILDVGCADGSFLHLLNDSWKKFGIDISAKAISAGKQKWGYSLSVADIRKLDFAKDSFDVVTLWMVLEHLVSPKEAIIQINRILKNRGIIVIRTPNKDSISTAIASLLYRISFGRFTKPLELFFTKLHLFYFNQRSLATLLQKNGFTVATARFDDRYVTKHALGSFSLSKRIALRVISFISRLTNKQDCITVYAIKTA